ncbi:MAG TPA: family 78 glycoside hydrolase catalytic domain [Prolixibacteraceae bacterium]|nr:family 78 glycoside hydrolase catalytic domain [Prolixibacteraceae bacterium]
MNITDLKCEYTTNPIGLDILKPQFSWQIQSERRGVMQTAYQLIVANPPDDLVHKDSVIWDSGKIDSSKSAGIRYAGPELESRKRYFWTVRVWNSILGLEKLSEPAIFEMGLLKTSDWQAEWIGCPASWTGRVLYFRREFSIEEKVKQARVYISGLGYYVLYVNGKRVGDQVLDPGTTDYSKRILYSTYDITSFTERENALGVMVGPGWYGIPKLRLQMEITLESGKREIIASSWDPYQNWLVTTGPTICSSIFDGETYDARQEKSDWNLPHCKFDGNNRTDQWINAVVTDAPGGVMVSQMQEPIKIIEKLHPAIIAEPADGIFVLDAGRNIAGWAAINVKGKSGTKITLKFAESLNQDGMVNQENLRSAAAKDTYILRGGDHENWEPSFTYHGFRYCQVEGFPYRPSGDDIRFQVVRSAVKSTGRFSCSNPLLNRIHEMVANTESNNLHSIPTDCPQRDERMGWLNDMTVRIEQALYNFDLSRFYMKWIDDIRDTQGADGTITDTAPFRWGFRPADPVSASYLLVALKSYEFYGNESIIRQNFNGLKAWVDYLHSRTDDGIVNYSYWGDWSPPEEFGTPGSIGSGAVSKYTPGKFISTGYLYYCAGIISQMASIIGNNEDKIHYCKIAIRIAEAINKTYWKDDIGGYGSNNQACNSFALFLGIADKYKINRVIANLVEDVKNHNFHLTTGNLCTKYLLEALTENGHADIAYKIATQDSYPGWGFMLANGATALWERWENKTGGEMNSHNHPMMGSVGSWFYKYVLGILPDIHGPGFEKFFIKPHIFNNFDFAEGEFHSIKGIIKSGWKKENGFLQMNLTIPGNSIAKVYVPTLNREKIKENNVDIDQSKGLKFLGMEDDYAIFELGSGSYHFKSVWK